MTNGKQLKTGNHATYLEIICEQCGVRKLCIKGNRYCSRECMAKAFSIPKPLRSTVAMSMRDYKKYHARVYRARGKAISCVSGCISSTYQWANVGDYTDVNLYVAMCGQCHRRFDHMRVAVITGFWTDKEAAKHDPVD